MTEQPQADYLWWQQALNGQFGSIHEGMPQAGFYRVRARKNGPWVPVAIWHEVDEDDEGNWFATRGEEEVDAGEIWSWCSRYPISYDDYEKVMAGGRFDDDMPTAIGDNQPPADDETTLAEQIDIAIGVARSLQEELTDDSGKLWADQAANVRDRLNSLWKKAEELRKREKKPYDDGAKEVQAKWRPVLERCKVAADQLRGPLGKILKAMQAQANAAAAEQAKARPEEAKPATRARVGGASSKKAALHTVKSAVVEDYDALIEHLKGNQEVRDLAQRIANQAAKADVALPGCKIVKEQAAR